MPRRQRFSTHNLDQRVELQKESVTEDGMGGQSSTWVTQATVWAQVRSRTGRERMHSDFLASQGGYQVVIRNRSDIDVRENWRVLWDGRAFNIRFVEDNGPRDLYLVLDCERGVAT